MTDYLLVPTDDETMLTTWRYERDRRAGTTLDYGRIFSANERALLAEHFDLMPWEPPEPERSEE